MASFCEQCTHLNNPQLDFIPGNLAGHRAAILRDLRELVMAAAAEMEKTVVMLTGSILEAVLYSFIQAPESYIAKRRGAFTFNPEGGLKDYKNIFDRWFGDVLPNVELPDSVVGYRDLVHINRELNSPPDICAQAGRDMLRMLNSLLGELKEFGSPP